jgi:hypothetical protein
MLILVGGINAINKNELEGSLTVVMTVIRPLANKLKAFYTRT